MDAVLSHDSQFDRAGKPTAEPVAEPAMTRRLDSVSGAQRQMSQMVAELCRKHSVRLDSSKRVPVR